MSDSEPTATDEGLSDPSCSPPDFEDEFFAWFDSDETQRRFHCSHASERDVAFSSAAWAKRFLEENSQERAPESRED